MADIILEMKSITKEFPGVKALDNVNLVVERGEIHALIGENGAGKSTLMNVLSGTYPVGSYTGEIYYNGELCQFRTLKDSEAKGIVIIHQELALIPLLTIGENMFLGNEKKNKMGHIDWDMTYNEAEKHMRQVGLSESAQTLIKDIGTGKQQLVEIASRASLHTVLDQVRRGYLTVEGGHRIGLCGSVWTENGQVKNLRCLSSLDLRVAHAVPGCGAGLLPRLSRLWKCSARRRPCA